MICRVFRSKISKNLKIKDTILQDDTVISRKLSELNTISQKFNDFLTYTRDNDNLKDYIDLELLKELIGVLNKILFSLKKHTEDKFIEKTSVKMLNQIINLLGKYKPLDNLRIFGSVAKGIDTENSDIDFLIDAHKGTTLIDLGGLQDELQTLLGVKVDLLTPQDISKHFRDNVLEEAIQL